MRCSNGLPWFVLLAFLPALAYSWPLESSDYQNYYEEFDAGRANTGTADYILQSAAGAALAGEGSSNTYTVRYGVYFTVYRDLLPPRPVTDMTAAARADGNVDLSWTATTDEESGVWGYRIYRYYYYGPRQYSVRVADAPENTSTAYTDQSDLLHGIQYFYELRPVDRAFNEQKSGNKQQTIAVTVQPASNTTLAASSRPGGDIYLTWAPVSGATCYIIYRSEIYGERGDPITAPGDVTQTKYLDVKTNLTGGRRYYYVAQPVVGGSENRKGNNQASAVCDMGGPNAPIISSETHPVPGQPYPNPDPAFRWVRAADPGMNLDLSGYYIKLDDSSATGTAVAGPGWSFVAGASAAFQGIGNGTWYFHCRGKDQTGNLGAEAVYCAVILATGAIQGQVTESGSGRLLEGMVVEAWLNGIKQRESRTGSDGAYLLPDVPFGEYTLRCNRFGYKPLEYPHAVLGQSNTPLTVDIAYVSETVIGKDQAAAYPNPAGGSEVRIIYYCEEPSEVTIEIFNTTGQMAARIQESKPAGYQYSVWPIRSVARGVYLFRAVLRGPNGKKTVLPVRKFSVIK